MDSRAEMTEQEVKTHIKSIITSTPIVSTIDSILRDYREIIGTRIPFQKFGYNSVEHFLKSIPDTCVVQGSGPFAQVTLIPSKKSAHINEMVVLQKTNTRGPRKFLGPKRRLSAPVRRPPTLNPGYNFPFTPNRAANSISSFGFSSSEKPLNTTSNNNAVCANAKSKDANLQRAPTTSADVKNINIYSDVTIPFVSVPNTSTRTKNINLQSTSTGSSSNVDSGRCYLRRGLRGENSEERRNVIIEQNKLGSQNVKGELNRLIHEQVKLGNVVVPSTSTPKKDTGLLNGTKKETENVCHHITSPKENRNGEHLEDNSSNIEDECFNRSKHKLNNLLNNFSTYEEEPEDTTNVPKRVQLNLRTLISQFMDGIWCSDLPNHYKRLFKKDLNYMEYGYTSLIEMCIALRKIFHYIRPGKDDFRLYDQSKPLPDSIEKYYTMASSSFEEKVTITEALPELDWTDFRGHIPNDIVKLGSFITREFLPIGTTVDSIFEVVVTEIYDPSKFWFYLGTSSSPTELDRLMDSIQAFYSNTDNAKDYAIPSGVIKVDLYCVQVIYSEYHRAKVISVLDDDPEHVRVMFIDYGTVCKVPIKGMCFLRTEFAVLNAQAIRCRLANIVPTVKGQPWLRETSDRLRSMVNRRDTKIKVSYIDWDDEYVCVFLADVTDNDNILYLNEVLVKENLAVWDGEPQMTTLVESNFKCNVQNVHLFPTFVELEYGLAPTASEMYALANMDIPLQFCIPEYFELDDQLLSFNREESMEELENSFIDIIGKNRKTFDLASIDIENLMKPPPIDFEIFGKLKEEMMEYCERTSAEEAQTENIPADVDENDEFGAIGEEPVGVWLERVKALDRQLKEWDLNKVTGESKELSDSIESVAGTSRELSGPESDKLSTIVERGEMEVDASKAPASPEKPFSEVVYNIQPKPDVNIFDNPEEFEGEASDNSEENEKTLTDPTEQSFLKTVEKLTTEDLEEEEIKFAEGSICPTENSTAIRSEPEIPVKFDLNLELRDPELQEAFRSFLKTRKLNSGNLSLNDSNGDQSANLCVEQDSQERTTNTEESFLKCKDQSTTEQEDVDDNSTEDSVRGACDTDLPFNSNLEDQKSFVSTWKLNNPFLSYFEAGDNTDHVSASPSEWPMLSRSISSSSDSSTINPPKNNPILKDVCAQTIVTSADSETLVSERLSLDKAQKNLEPNNTKFKRPETPPRLRKQKTGSNPDSSMSWVQTTMEARGMNTPPRVQTPPRPSNQIGGPVVTNQWSGSWAQNPMGHRGMMMTPHGIETPPRMFTGPGFTPPCFPPYAPWSHGTGYPVPQYTQWSNGGNHPMQRPPAAYQERPSNFNTFNTGHGRMVPPVPMYQQGGPIYYPPQRPPMPLPTIANDFYDRYNESLLRHAEKPS